MTWADVTSLTDPRVWSPTCLLKTSVSWLARKELERVFGVPLVCMTLDLLCLYEQRLRERVWSLYLSSCARDPKSLNALELVCGGYVLHMVMIYKMLYLVEINYNIR